LHEAIKAWTRSHDFSTSEDDLFNVSYTIAQAAFENQSTAFLSKYAGEADARDKGRDPTKTMKIKVLDAFASLAQENWKDAAIKLTNVQIFDEDALASIARPRDLAFYVIICSLRSLNRAEIKTQILSASGFKNLMEMSGSGNTEDVIENFLNGRYMDFQRQIVQITSKMKFDLYFGRRLDSVNADIRRKALI